jgi:hypothetical protein
MKANQYGTPTEQRRHAQGWLSASQRPARPACPNCRHVEAEFEDRYPRDLVHYRCAIGHFATSPGAVCNRHEPKP